MSKLMRALGLMSGTSMDGIDVAVIETDGADVVHRGGARTYPYSPEFRDKLRSGLDDARRIRAREDRPGRLALIEQYLTDLHAEAVQQFCEDFLIEPADIDVIGFHGQTVLHRPVQVVHRLDDYRAGVPDQSDARRDTMLTVQIGDGSRLARATGIDVVHDLRAADCAAGGQGAPLVPVYHRALVAALPQRPIAVLNVGGVANLTYIDAKGEMIAFDTGPGNAMVDDWMAKRKGHPHDPDGRFAAQGHVHDDYVSEYLKHSHFALTPPKSLDRNAFALELVDTLSDADGAATLTAFSAQAVAHARAHLPQEPELWVITGGGRRNRTLMSMIAAAVENAVVPAETVGWDGDAIEAEAWAYLAVRALKGLPNSFPETTGASAPTVGGVLAQGR